MEGKNRAAPVYRTRDEWILLIQEFRASGLTRAEWCKRHRITMSVMLRWEHQLSDKLAFQQSEDQHLQFEEVVLPNPSMSIPTVSENCAPSGHDGLQAPLAEFIIEYGGCRIHIGSHFNEQNLAKVMRVLQHA